MLHLNEIKKEFDPQLSGIMAYRSMIKEYLQARVLEFISRGPFKEHLVFIGGTKLRLINGFRRFSDDLDFDLASDYNSEDHFALCESIVASFGKMNIRAEIDREKKIKSNDVKTRFINFPDILEHVGLKDTPGRKFFIKLDAQKHHFGSYSYTPEMKVLNRFDVFVPVKCAPDSMILATKMCSILDRSKGRDFYDIVELTKTVRPDIKYIANRLEYGRLQTKYTGPETYLDLILPVLDKTDWNDKTREIEKFLFNPVESEKVKMFTAYATPQKIREWLSIG
jgi:predicted nucleotidyltransferase component of viral defense system